MSDPARPISVLIDLMRAVDGFAGIPQETRLLFSGLAQLEGAHTQGLIQSPDNLLAEGLPATGSAELARMPPDEQIDRLCKVVITFEEKDKRYDPRSVIYTVLRVLSHWFGDSQKLSHFNARRFRDYRDYLWWRFFALTLPPTDFEAVTGAEFRVVRMPWHAMHMCAYVTRWLGLRTEFVRLDTSEFDVMIAQTPYPATIAKNTRLVVRYHDALPLTMPYTIGDRHFHQGFHLQGLRHNLASGAWFACVSEATRNDLIAIFPQAAQRSVTIHNIVSHLYFNESSTPDRVPEIIRTRPLREVQKLLTPAMNRRRLDENPESTPPQYLLIVSRVELRKNHQTLLSAWERLRATRFPSLQLIAVGQLAPHHEPIISRFRPWVELGAVHMLEEVPSADLRILYKHARATMCPSVGEGFDYSGVEAMRCGGVVVASDIPVHREIYGEAAVYFNPYDLDDAVQAIQTVIDPAQAGYRAELVERGAEISARYTSTAIIPKWQKFLLTITGQRSHTE